MDWYWIGMLVVGGSVLVLAVWGIRQFIQQDKILQNGVWVPGRIIEHREYYSPRRVGVYTHYYVTYSYEYEGKTYSREQEVSKEIYLASPDEAKVSVHFLPDDPTQVVTNFEEGIS